MDDFQKEQTKNLLLKHLITTGLKPELNTDVNVGMATGMAVVLTEVFGCSMQEIEEIKERAKMHVLSSRK